MFTTLPLDKIAYAIIVLAITLKTYGLYVLSSKKGLSMERKKKIYHYFNWPANIILLIGVIILATKWYM